MAVVYLLTQVRIVITTSLIFAGNGMRRHLGVVSAVHMYMYMYLHVQHKFSQCCSRYCFPHSVSNRLLPSLPVTRTVTRTVCVCVCVCVRDTHHV